MGVDYINLAQGRKQWRDSVSTVINLRASEMLEIFHQL